MPTSLEDSLVGASRLEKRFILRNSKEIQRDALIASISVTLSSLNEGETETLSRKEKSDVHRDDSFAST